MNLNRLNEEPLATAFLESLQKEEADQQVRNVNGSDLKLNTNGFLTVAGQEFDYSPEAQKDLASLGQIPELYFRDIDPESRAFNFNRRQDKFASQRLSVIRNDKTVLRVRRAYLAQLPNSKAVELILSQVPAGTIPNDIRAVVYAHNGHLDASFISPAIETQPRRGDVVCGGVHLTVETDGGIQVGPAIYRLVCANGAMSRICGDGGHRIRRAPSESGDRSLLASLTQASRKSWLAWEETVAGLEQLASQRLDPQSLDRLVARLQQRPFFISATVAKRVRDALQAQGNSDLTLYDLQNAITHVGTHATDILPRYRYRLRLGAGSMIQRHPEVCNACQQMILD